MKEFKGVFRGNNLSNEEYHSEKDHLSSSNLKMLLKDIEKFHDEKILGNRKNEQKNCFDEGSLVHGMILEPHLLDDEFVMFDGMRKAGKIWEAFKAAEIAGKNRTILSKPQWKRCERMVEAFKLNTVAKEMIGACESELSLFLEYRGVPIKVRADSIDVENGIIVDLKTTAYPTDIDSFKYTVKDFGYDLSAALYTKMFEEHYGKPFQFFWAVIGKKDFSCNIYKMSDKTREEGNRSINKALSVFKECKKSGLWVNKKVDILNKVCDNDYTIEEI